MLMYNNNFSSKLFQQAITEFMRLPGVGYKTAMRFVLYLLKQDAEQVTGFGNTIIQLRNEIKFCIHCHNISDTDVCSICSNPNRNSSLICVVENIKDVISIENTHQYNGVYHVLGGIISPMDGIGPNDLNIDSLEKKVASGAVNEVIFALSTTMEGDTTNFYLYRKLAKYGIIITTLARGVAIGDEIEYADELTLGRSIVNRTLFENTLIEQKVTT